MVDEAMDYIIPAIIILVANLCSGAHGSTQWENVTAAFGWTGAVAFFLYLALLLVGVFFPSVIWVANNILAPVACLSILQAVSRDYERVLKPIVDRWQNIRKSND